MQSSILIVRRIYSAYSNMALSPRNVTVQDISLDGASISRGWVKTLHQPKQYGQEEIYIMGKKHVFALALLCIKYLERSGKEVITVLRKSHFPSVTLSNNISIRFCASAFSSSECCNS